MLDIQRQKILWKIMQLALSNLMEMEEDSDHHGVQKTSLFYNSGVGEYTWPFEEEDKRS